MGISILYGESRSDLMKTCLEQVCRFRRDYPDSRAVLLVPETSKMDVEYEFLTGTPEHGMMLTEVLSFSRFCYRILGEIGSDPGDLIDDAGKSMLLYKILQANEDRFVLFKNLYRKPGFIAEILSVMGELKRVLIDAPKLERASREMDDTVIAQKAKELAILIREYDLALKEIALRDPQENYTRTTEHILRLAKEKALSKDSSVPWPYNRLAWLFNAKVWVAGFGESRDFTPQEYAMMDALNQCCGLTVTLVCGREAGSAKDDENTAAGSIFRAGAQSMARFRKSGLMGPPPRYVAGGNPTVFSSLASRWRDQDPGPLTDDSTSLGAGSVSKDPAASPVTLIHASTKRGEVAILAGEIGRLVREEHFRYRDICVAAAGMESYSGIVHAAFTEGSIPYYLDEKKSLGRTALARMVRSLLDICLQNWSHKSLMTFARCGLCNATQSEIDELETFMLSRGIKWRSQLFDDARFDMKWDLSRPDDTDDPEDPEETERPPSTGLCGPDPQYMVLLRDRVCRNALAFETSCRQGSVCGDYCRALREFLLAEETAQKIDRMSGALLEKNLEDAATGLVKAWNELLHLLDQMERIGQDTPMDLELFRGILLSGMDKAVSGTIPSTVDQVQFTSVRQMGARQYPVVFIIGLTDGAYPEKLPPEGILKDCDREAFSEFFGIGIPSVVTDKYFEDLFRTYCLFSLPSKRLYLSCPESRDRESSIIRFVRECVPDCRSIRWSESPRPADLQIYSKKEAFHTLVSMMECKSADPVCKEWEAFHQVLSRQPEFGARLHGLKERTKTSQGEIHLPNEKIIARYRDRLAMSVSQLETYSACAYSHFAKYLLKLQPRVTWELQPTDTGSLLHGIVETGVRQFLEEYSAAGDPDEKQTVLENYRTMDFEQFAKEKMDAVIRRDRMGAFRDQGFNASKGRTSCRLAASTLQAAFRQFEQGEFLPAFLEWDFSQTNNNALSFQLPGSPPLVFNGKIDRVDVDGSYFRVIDYKSGGKTVEFDKWYHGLSLQLPAYIAAFGRQYPDMLPKEAAYMEFARPILSYENGSSQEIREKHEENLKKKYPLHKSGLEPEELAAASRHTIGKMKTLSGDLLDGKYSVNPKKVKGKGAPCDYCDYRSVCGFESKYDSFNILEPLVRTKDDQGKLLPKSAVFCKKIAGEDKT